MHVLIFFILAILTFPYWFPVAVFGGTAIILCWVAIAIPFLCIRWIYRHFQSPQDGKEARQDD